MEELVGPEARCSTVRCFLLTGCGGGFQTIARTIRQHKPGVLAAIQPNINNGRLEVLNSHVGLISHRAHGFHLADALIAMIYLCCVGIQIDLPSPMSHLQLDRRARKGRVGGIIQCRSGSEPAENHTVRSTFFDSSLTVGTRYGPTMLVTTTRRRERIWATIAAWASAGGSTLRRGQDGTCVYLGADTLQRSPQSRRSREVQVVRGASATPYRSGEST